MRKHVKIWCQLPFKQSSTDITITRRLKRTLTLVRKLIPMDELFIGMSFIPHEVRQKIIRYPGWYGKKNKVITTMVIRPVDDTTLYFCRSAVAELGIPTKLFDRSLRRHLSTDIHCVQSIGSFHVCPITWLLITCYINVKNFTVSIPL